MGGRSWPEHSMVLQYVLAGCWLAAGCCPAAAAPAAVLLLLPPRGPPCCRAERLAGEHAVRPSLDAGRFVCNWTYYLSLLHSQKARQRRGRPLHTLFLHVPPTAAIPLPLQFAFLLDLLAAIAEQLGGGSGHIGVRSSMQAATAAVVEPVAAVVEPAAEPALPVLMAAAAGSTAAGAAAAKPVSQHHHQAL